MPVNFLLGPAGTGKTWRCLAEIRAELTARPDGPPLVLLAPKQATFQLERQLLAEGGLAGFTRLHILSFPRLAHFLHELLGEPEPRLLEETGRVMVLQALLQRHRTDLPCFGRCAGLPGMAGEVSRQLREFQEQGWGPDDLAAAAAQAGTPRALAEKLRDLARLARAYTTWLGERGLTDPDALLEAAAQRLATARRAGRAPRLGGVWLDGFAEMTPPELGLLTEIVTGADRATLAFCLDGAVPEEGSPLSPWNVIGETFRRAYAQVAGATPDGVQVERLARDPGNGRFARRPDLARLEATWWSPTGQTGIGSDSGAGDSVTLQPADSVEAEALVAARAIWRHVAAGGRYRECAVLLRSLDSHGDVFRRAWRRLGIPFFLDQREPLGTEPLTSLTRCALRLGLGEWPHSAWFGVLRSGLAGLELEAVDRLENEALARGWTGGYWSGAGAGVGAAKPPANHGPLAAPFRRFCAALRSGPTGDELATALTTLWGELGVPAILQRWDETAGTVGLGRHQAVWRQLEAWVSEVRQCLGATALPPEDWLEVFESGWLGLSVGLVPPALDQVLIGAMDRSRNPNLSLVILPGWNEGLFPARAGDGGLLSEPERRWLQTGPGPARLPQVVSAAQESFFAYIGLTRAADQVLVTWVEAPPPAAPRSPYVNRLLQIGVAPGIPGPDRTVDLWRELSPSTTATPRPAVGDERLDSAVAALLYERPVRLSASRLERFAACRHQSWLGDGLRVEERPTLQFEAREQGDYAHRILAEYHRCIVAEGATWGERQGSEVDRRFDLAVVAARVRAPGSSLPRRAYTEELLVARVRRFVHDTAEWMPAYGFAPKFAELGFGRHEGIAALEVRLDSGETVTLVGQMDRVDAASGGGAPVLVLDYKSGVRTWQDRATAEGLELQLPIYALALRAAGLEVGGMVYVAWSEKTAAAPNRAVARQPPGPRAPTHRGRLRESTVGFWAGRTEQLPFKVKWTKAGKPDQRSDVRPDPEFGQLLDDVGSTVRRLVSDLLAGGAAAVPNPSARELPCLRCPVRMACPR